MSLVYVSLYNTEHSVSPPTRAISFPPLFWTTFEKVQDPEESILYVKFCTLQRTVRLDAVVKHTIQIHPGLLYDRQAK